MANYLPISPNFLNKLIPLILAIYRTNSNADILIQILLTSPNTIPS
jgi:hypothetical protein